VAPSSGGGGGGGGNTATIVKPAVVDPIKELELVPEAVEAPVEKKQTDREVQTAAIGEDAKAVFESGTNLEAILHAGSKTKDGTAQKKGMDKFTLPLVKGAKGLTTSQIYAINNFIVYGTKSTQVLGAGERAGVVASFKSAFGRFPTTEADWKDCLAIGNGRWPAQKNAVVEKSVKMIFKKIYKREAKLDNANDKAALAILAYGLRMNKRNQASEAAALKTYAKIFKAGPKSAADWNVVRAIAYSGAKR
jgi:hypothetical protein